MIMNEIIMYLPIVEPKSRSNGVVSSASSLVNLSKVGLRYWSPIEIESDSLGEMTSFLLLVFCSIGGIFSELLDIVHSNVSSTVAWVASKHSLGRSPKEDLFVESLSSWAKSKIWVKWIVQISLVNENYRMIFLELWWHVECFHHDLVQLGIWDWRKEFPFVVCSRRLLRL